MCHYCSTSKTIYIIESDRVGIGGSLHTVTTIIALRDRSVIFVVIFGLLN